MPKPEDPHSREHASGFRILRRDLGHFGPDDGGFDLCRTRIGGDPAAVTRLIPHNFKVDADQAGMDRECVWLARVAHTGLEGTIAKSFDDYSTQRISELTDPSQTAPGTFWKLRFGVLAQSLEQRFNLETALPGEANAIGEFVTQRIAAAPGRASEFGFWGEFIRLNPQTPSALHAQIIAAHLTD